MSPPRAESAPVKGRSEEDVVTQFSWQRDSVFNTFDIRILRFIRFVYSSSEFISVKLDFCIVRSHLSYKWLGLFPT